MQKAGMGVSYKLTAYEHLCSIPAYLLGLCIMLFTNWGWWHLPFLFLWVGLCGWIAVHGLRRSPTSWLITAAVVTWPLLVVGAAFAFGELVLGV